jgi:translation initiation factor 2 alpha subunit (eIF-2alpha)
MSSNFLWYGEVVPKEGDVVMTQVVDYSDGVGFNLVLPEYANHPAQLLLSHLAKNKKIRHGRSPAVMYRSGDLVPLMVTEVDNSLSPVLVTNKGIGDLGETCQSHYTSTGRLYGLCRRLHNMAKDISEEDWQSQFQALMNNWVHSDEDLPHPLCVIQNRVSISPHPSIFQTVLITHHADLFGVTPVTKEESFLIYTFHPQGNQLVKDALLELESKLKPESQKSDMELFQDQNAANFAITLVLPKILVKITAYREEKCLSVLDECEKLLHTHQFTVCIRGA